jgi:hypothetical protein
MAFLASHFCSVKQVDMTTTKQNITTKYLKLTPGWSHQYFSSSRYSTMPISLKVGEYRLYPSILGNIEIKIN